MVVAGGELAYLFAEALDLLVQVGREGGVDAGQIETIVRRPGQQVAAVHVHDQGQERPVAAQGGEGLAAQHLVGRRDQVARQAAAQHRAVARGHRGVWRAALGLQQVELEALILVADGPVQDDHGKGGQILVFDQGGVKGRDQLAGLHQGVVAGAGPEVRIDEAGFYLEVLADRHDLGKILKRPALREPAVQGLAVYFHPAERLPPLLHARSQA